MTRNAWIKAWIINDIDILGMHIVLSYLVKNKADHGTDLAVEEFLWDSPSARVPG